LEHRSPKPGVGGSNPSRPAMRRVREIARRGEAEGNVGAGGSARGPQGSGGGGDQGQLGDAPRGAGPHGGRDGGRGDRFALHRRRGSAADLRNRLAVQGVSVEQEDGPGARSAGRKGIMSKKWYVVHTYSGHENKVKVNLEKAIHSAGLNEAFGQILV